MCTSGVVVVDAGAGAGGVTLSPRAGAIAAAQAAMAVGGTLARLSLQCSTSWPHVRHGQLACLVRFAGVLRALAQAGATCAEVMVRLSDAEPAGAGVTDVYTNAAAKWRAAQSDLAAVLAPGASFSYGGARALCPTSPLHAVRVLVVYGQPLEVALALAPGAARVHAAGVPDMPEPTPDPESSQDSADGGADGGADADRALAGALAASRAAHVTAALGDVARVARILDAGGAAPALVCLQAQGTPNCLKRAADLLEPLRARVPPGAPLLCMLQHRPAAAATAVVDVLAEIPALSSALPPADVCPRRATPAWVRAHVLPAATPAQLAALWACLPCPYAPELAVRIAAAHDHELADAIEDAGRALPAPKRVAAASCALTAQTADGACVALAPAVVAACTALADLAGSSADAAAAPVPLAGVAAADTLRAAAAIVQLAAAPPGDADDDAGAPTPFALVRALNYLGAPAAAQRLALHVLAVWLAAR